MRRDQLEHAIRAACHVSGDKELLILGSQAILGSHPDAPKTLRASIEVDIQAENYPDNTVYVLLLQPAYEAILLAPDFLKLVVGELAPLFPRMAFEFFPLASMMFQSTCGSLSRCGLRFPDRVVVGDLPAVARDETGW